MATNQPEPKMEFRFVNSTTAKVPQTLAVRALIRKQAMKQASITRRKNGSYGKHNLRQYPVFVQDSNGEDAKVKSQSTQSGGNGTVVRRQLRPKREEDDSNRPSQDEIVEWYNSNLLAKLAMSESIPATVSRKGYEEMSMKYGFNILDLSNLATFFVSRATGVVLSTDPSQLIHLLRYKQWSIFQYLPSRYEHTQCVKDATNCVVARVRQLISPPSHNLEATVLSSYVKALRSLQAALDSPKTRFKPEVLYATEILALYELLDSSGQAAWIRHVAGAARLIELRGPKAYQTEFEKALFIAHAGAIMTESMLNNETCFLEEPEWTGVFKSIIVKDSFVSDRSETAINLLILKSYISRIFLDVTNAVCYPEYTGGPPLADIVTRAEKLKADLRVWRAKLDALCPRPWPSKDITMYDKVVKVVGVYYSLVILSNRLVAAVSGLDRAKMEADVQNLADQSLGLAVEARSVSAQAKLFLAQSGIIAQTVKETAADWMDMSDVVVDEKGVPVTGLIDKEKFVYWCSLLGRKTC
ncbi:hypothetical protein F5884DRAFT_745744 [Xylogone sp. PMI_703]|nr:hypothetical protein F5884DRAFT_745744 [Xylogone sp. PMI_703]